MDILSISLGAKKALDTLGVKVEKTKTVVFPETTIQLGKLDGSPVAVAQFEGNVCSLVAGKIYTVNWNGAVYQLECKAIPAELGFPGAYIGLAEWEWIEDVPFGFTYVEDENATALIAYPVVSEATCSISTETETIHPIDPKFLPAGVGGAGLPVVELTTKASLAEEGAEVTLTAEEAALLDAAWEKKLPCVISTGVEGMTDVLMGTFIRHDDPSYFPSFEALFYHTFVGILIITVSKAISGWYMRVDMYHPEYYIPGAQNG